MSDRIDNWFFRQLEVARKESLDLPDWAREEAGLKPVRCTHTYPGGKSAFDRFVEVDICNLCGEPNLDTAGY